MSTIIRSGRISPFLLHGRVRHLANKSNVFSATLPATPPEKKPQKNWLTRRVESSPLSKKVFLAFTNLLGYGSPKQIAGRRTFAIYEKIAAIKPDEDREFWQQGASTTYIHQAGKLMSQSDCHLPPTFQSWFTITNLHIWMLTVRFRALPEPHGRHYEQGLIDHFFLDIEDRIRTVLQPPAEPTDPYTFHTNFYPSPDFTEGKKKRKRAPDRLVTKQMKIFKEQWAGMGLAFDLALLKGDMEMAAAVWRNLLGARGAQGITYPSPSSTSPKYRRTVNLVGGEVVDVSKLNVEKEETTDDGSGVHDFPPEDADRYLLYPTVMLGIVGYVRRELVRLQAVSDEQITDGNFMQLKFSKVRMKEQS